MARATSSAARDSSTARPSAGKSAFEQKLERALQPGGLGLLGEPADIRRRIGQAIEIEAGVAPELVEHIADGLPAHELVGKDDALEAEFAGNLDLMGRRHGDSPGAVPHLALEQLRAHGGLAMGRDDRAGFLQEAAHPAAVMGQRALLEHRQRQWQILPQDIPALVADVPKTEGRDAAGHALHGLIEDEIVDVTLSHISTPSAYFTAPIVTLDMNLSWKMKNTIASGKVASTQPAMIVP